ncbi:hypothetical protein [Sphingomonas sp. 3-13AW]|uniref:hypothetical protein n=1 Tax=Sphingomonas sp. 3-13AW TaxID=3050450 RepID=UPI003BB520A5
MKHSNVSAEMRDKSIEDADLGVAGWARKSVRRVAKFRDKKDGYGLVGEIAIRFAQMLLGLAVFCVAKATFGIPFNFVSGVALLGMLVGSSFGAVRFSLFSLLYWAVVGAVFGFAFGVWPLSPSWWSAAAEGWESGEAVPKVVVGGAVIATIVWVAAGRLASKALGKAFVNALELWTFKRSEDVRRQRQEDVLSEFEKVGVSRAEVDDLARRSEFDGRRAVVFGGVRARSAQTESEAVSLAKMEPSEAEPDADDAAQRVADLAGHVDSQDAELLAGLADGPDLGAMFGGTLAVPNPVEESAGAVSHEDEVVLHSSDSMDLAGSRQEDEPGVSHATLMSPSTALADITEKVDAPAPIVSAPQVNPEASRGRRRRAREELGKMIDLFAVMSREAQVDVFVNISKNKLIRLTDEDYEELRTLDGGEVLITLSQDLKLKDQARGRSAVKPAEMNARAEGTIMGSNSNMADSDSNHGLSSAGAMLVDAMEHLRGAASGRVPLGAPAPHASTTEAHVEGDAEDFEKGILQPAPVRTSAVAAPSSGERPNEISAVTAEGENVSFEVAIPGNESNEAEMRRYPTPYASARVSILGNSALADKLKIEKLRELDRLQGVSTIEMFEGDDIVSLLNLPPKVMTALREKVRALLGEKPSDMTRLQTLYEKRVELVQKDMFERPHEYQRILSAFMAAAGDMQELVDRVDTPQAREILENSIRLDPWFEQNLTGLRAGRLKTALPLPAKGPGVLDRFSGTVDAAMRGAGFAGTNPQAPPAPQEPAPAKAPKPSDVAVDAPTRRVNVPEPAQEPRADARTFQKGVDGQWTPDAPKDSDVFNKEMAEHFAMMVQRNAAIKADERREAEAAAELAQREEAERVERERVALEHQARENEENERNLRVSAFFAGLPQTDTGPFVTVLPRRFATEEIMAAIASIADGHAIMSRDHHEYVAQKIAFLKDWEAEKGSQPDVVDELSAPGQKLQADISVRNGEIARDLIARVAVACGLTEDAIGDELNARLADEQEREFVRAVEKVRLRGEELRRLVEAWNKRRMAVVAEEARDEVRRHMSEAAPSDPAPSQELLDLQARLEQQEREAEELRRANEEAARRAAAAERSAAERQAAADAAILTAEGLAARVRELEASLADGGASNTDDEEGGVEQDISEILSDRMRPFEASVDLKAYLGRNDREDMLAIDLPDAIVEANEITLGEHRMPLVEGIKRGVLRPAFTANPMMDTVAVLLVTSAPLASDFTAAALGSDASRLMLCARDSKRLDRILKAMGAA